MSLNQPRRKKAPNLQIVKSSLSNRLSINYYFFFLILGIVNCLNHVISPINRVISPINKK